MTAGDVLVDGRPRPKSHRLAGGEEVDVELPAARVLVPVELGARRRRTRTSTCSSSTSLRASSCIPPDRTVGRRSRTVCSRSERRAETRAAGARPPPRPRHVRVARRRALRRGARAAHRRDSRATGRARATSRSSWARRVREPAGSRRRSAATAATERAARSTPRRRGTRSRGSRCRSSSGRARSSRCGSRRGGRTRSASIWRRSSLPVCGDPVYGVAGDLGLERQFLHAHRLRFEHPFTGARARPLVAAPARPRGGARASTRGVAATIRRFRPADPTSLRTGVPAPSSPVPSAPAGAPQSTERTQRGSRLHEGAAGGRGALRPPDAPLEPEDEALHLRRARRHLHHRPPADAGAAPGGVRLRAKHLRARRLDPVRRDEEAGAGGDRPRGDARRPAVRGAPLARRPAHQLAHDRRPHLVPAGAPPPEGGRPARPPAGQGAHRDGRRAREARGEPGRRLHDEAPARRRVHRRPAQGAARAARGAAARPARDRARGHELRPRRGVVRRSGQRRRDPLVLARDPRDRRRHRGRQDEGDGGRDRSGADPGGAGAGARGRRRARCRGAGRGCSRARPRRATSLSPSRTEPRRDGRPRRSAPPWSRSSATRRAPG